MATTIEYDDDNDDFDDDDDNSDKGEDCDEDITGVGCDGIDFLVVRFISKFNVIVVASGRPQVFNSLLFDGVFD